MRNLPAQAIYIHIPFCIAKCAYCDFTSYPGQGARHEEYVAALCQEIERAVPQAPISTIYIGGGTPTVLSAEQLSGVLGALFSRFEVEADAEITLEANPGTVDLAKLRALRGAGFNRLSLGVQALDDAVLRKLGRIHTVEQARQAYQNARAAGFDNLSLDLIFALPEQTLDKWGRTLAQAVELAPEHASLYELSIEEGTKFAELYAAGRLEIPDEDVRLDMYEAAIKTLTAAGYEHYEVSNFARPGRRSRHNQVYWRNESYFGFGAGAVRYLDGVRCNMTISVARYIADIRAGLDPTESCEQLTERALMGETVMLALRTTDGLDLRAFEARFGTTLAEAYGPIITSLQRDELVELTPTHLRPTHQGLLLANQIALQFIEVPD